VALRLARQRPSRQAPGPESPGRVEAAGGTGVAVRAFGQLAAYTATIATHGRDFIIAYSKKSSVAMHQGRWLEATADYQHIRIAFYVALTDKACKRINLLRAMKNLLPHVGIIRVKPDGYCRFYLRAGKHKHTKVARPRSVIIKILPQQNGAVNPNL